MAEAKPKAPAETKAKPSAEGQRSRGRKRAATPAAERDWQQEVEQLSYQEARTALDLAIASLQASDLEVEQMAGLYRRAEAYARRCEAVLAGVEQDVIEWDADAS